MSGAEPANDAMAYLRKNPKLEEAVSACLCKVVNERAAEPLTRIVELLASEVGCESPVALKYRVEQLTAEKDALNERCRAAEERAAQLEKQLASDVVRDSSAVGVVRDESSSASKSSSGVGAAEPLEYEPVPPPVDGKEARQQRRAAVMAALFDTIARGAATVAPEKVDGLRVAFQQGLDQNEDESERAAMGAFLTTLQELSSRGRALSKPEWVDASLPMLPETEVTFLELIEGLLAEEEAVDGLLETIDEAAGGGGDADDGRRLPDQRAATRSWAHAASNEWANLLGDVFTHILDTELRGEAIAQGDGVVAATRVASLARAIGEGCQASDDEAERTAMTGFAGLLTALSAKRDRFTRPQWLSELDRLPADVAMQPDEQRMAREVLESIFESDDSLRGLAETVIDIEQQDVAK